MFIIGTANHCRIAAEITKERNVLRRSRGVCDASEMRAAHSPRFFLFACRPSQSFDCRCSPDHARPTRQGGGQFFSFTFATARRTLSRRNVSCRRRAIPRLHVRPLLAPLEGGDKRTASSAHQLQRRIATRIQNLTRLNSFDAGSGHKTARLSCAVFVHRNPTLRI